MIKIQLTKGGFASMINHNLTRKHTLSVVMIDAYGTLVSEFCPNTTFLQIDGDFRGSKILPEVLTA